MKEELKRDFTIAIYKELCRVLQDNKYKFITLNDYLSNKQHEEKVAIMRHDIDIRLNTALKMAKLENTLGIRATYYFRFNKGVFKPVVIRQINNLGHEVGYHYELLSKTKGNYAIAIKLFEKELKEFRKVTQIQTISSHGSPLSRWDNKKLWEKCSFREFAITGDANLSLDFNDILYLTDTGRGWNRDTGNIRDRVNSKFNYKFYNTQEIIAAIKQKKIPNKIIFNIHPDRWSDNLFMWGAELVGQNIKNSIKNFVFSHERIQNSL